MQISLVKHGNSQAFVIPKAILDLLKIDKETKFEVETNGEDLSFHKIKEQDEKFKFAKENILKRHSNLYKNLADR